MTVEMASDSKATSVIVRTRPRVSRRRWGAHTPSSTRGEDDVERHRVVEGHGLHAVTVRIGLRWIIGRTVRPARSQGLGPGMLTAPWSHGTRATRRTSCTSARTRPSSGSCPTCRRPTPISHRWCGRSMTCTRRSSGSRGTARGSRSGPRTGARPTSSAPRRGPGCTPSRTGGSSGCAPASCSSTGSIPRGFAPWPGADGYWVATEDRVPVDVTPVGDLLARHRERGHRAPPPGRPATVAGRGDRLGLPLLDVPHDEHLHLSAPVAPRGAPPTAGRPGREVRPGCRPAPVGPAGCSGRRRPDRRSARRWRRPSR